MKLSQAAAAGEITEKYERIRQSVLEAGPAGCSSCRWGRALLMQQGMAAWLAAQQHSEFMPPARRHSRVQPASPAQSEIVNVLTTVILNNYWEKSHAF